MWNSTRTVVPDNRAVHATLRYAIIVNNRRRPPHVSALATIVWRVRFSSARTRSGRLFFLFIPSSRDATRYRKKRTWRRSLTSDVNMPAFLEQLRTPRCISFGALYRYAINAQRYARVNEFLSTIYTFSAYIFAHRSTFEGCKKRDERRYETLTGAPDNRATPRCAINDCRPLYV